VTRAWLGAALAALLWLLAPLPAAALDDGITDYVTIPAGSYIVDTGSLTPTVANAMKPYGLLFDLVRNQKVPVAWAINPSKAKDGTDFTDPQTGKSYRAGAFIIRADYVTSAVVTTISNWRAQGVVVDGPTTGSIASVPVYDEISGIANIVSDLQNGKIAEAFMTRAGIPSTAYRRDTPQSLSACDDMFIMPHADPTWASHSNLLPFVQSRGYIWSGCHAVSVLENIDNPATPTVNPDLNFLSTKGLVPFGSHQDGSPPYTSTLPGEPVMQFIGTTDAAQQGGSEQIYLPSASGSWRPGARLYVTDPTTPADVPSKSNGPAAAIVAGRAFDNPSYGRVMYEGGHDVGGTAPANIAAQRAFFNFWLLALIDRSPDVAISAGNITVVSEGTTLTLTSSVNHPFPITGYQWTSSSGGTFSAPNSATTVFTPPEVASDTPLVLRVTVTDGCNRTAFDAYQVTVSNVAKADLAIAKTASALAVAVNAAYSYTLAVSNLGTEAAADVLVEDVLPAGLGYVSATGSGWTCGYDSQTRKVSCTRSSLALTGGTPSNITINVTAPVAPTSVSNTATVSSATPDFVPGNNSSTTTTTVLEGVDVAIAKTAPAGAITAGAPFAYTLAVQNLSPVVATSLTVNDTLPSSLSFVSATGAGWDCIYQSTDRRVTCFRGSLAAAASSTITLTVIPSGSAGSDIVNTARVSSPDFQDENPANNSSSVSSTLVAPADLAVTKTGSTTGGGGSSQLDTYVVTLTNNGPGAATGIVVTDVMSGPGVTKYNENAAACTVVPSAGTVSPASPWTIAQVTSGGTWSLASLANGASATLTVTCAGDNNDGVMNVATVTATSYDANTANNLASAYIADGGIKNADLRLTKTDSPDPVLVGGTLTYRLTLNNLGTEDANSVLTVVDTLPAGVSYLGFANVTGGGTWNCTASGATVTCTTSSDLKKLTGSPNTLFFDLTVTAPVNSATITNTATLQYAWGNDEYDPPANNTATATTTVIYPSTDVSVTKTVDTATPALGANVTFTVTVRNNGPNAASNLRVQDLLPAGLEFVSASAGQGSYDPYDPATGLWYVGALAVNATATLTLTAKAASSQTTTNQACLYALNQTDTNAANNCGSAVVSPQSADLRLTKTVDTATPNLGSNATFTITLTNLGPSSTTATTVLDQLLQGLEYVSHAAATGAYDPVTGVWAIGSALAGGATATLSIVAKVNEAATPLTNTASVTSSSVPDPDPSNNIASVTLTGQAADIAVTKSVDITAPLLLNTPLTFTITARNDGPSDATGVVVTDLLPAGLSYQSHTASQGSYVPGTGQWTVDALANGASATLTIVATNTAFGSIVNTAARTASAQTDANQTNDTAAVSVLSGGAADLALTKSADTPSTYVGDSVNFTLQLRNYGPNPASGVVVSDLLPAGLNYVSHAASQGTYAPGTGLWTVGALAVDQQVELQLVATAAVPGNVTNTGAVATLDQADPDTTNNSAAVTLDVSPAADLSVTKTGPGSASQGSTVTYTLVARNTGPSNVTGASLADTVPAQIGSTSWSCVASGTADCDTLAAGTGASGSNNVISLNNVSIAAGAGNYLTVTVNGTATTNGTIVNTVTFSPPGDGSIFDPDVTNNAASATTVISNRVLRGRVFADTGVGTGGVPNDGARNGDEPGIPGVTVRLTDCGSTDYATTTTDGAGDYAIAIPELVAAGATVCVVETNPTGYTSTGGQAGSTGGSYDRGADRVQFVIAAGAAYSGVDFGDVPDNRFLTDGTMTAQPGSSVSYPHIFIAGSGGQVSFSTLGASSPDVPGWSEVLYRDADCDGVLATPGDTQLTGAVTVQAGERLCLIVQEFAPAGLPSGATRVVTVQAFFVYSNASPALTASYTRQDVTVTSSSALLLVKEVRNVTQSGGWVKSNAAAPGNVLEYRITYANSGSTAIGDLVINDMTPAFSVFAAGACGAPLPASLTQCTLTSPAVGATGPLRWQFTGLLQPAASGTVTYQVSVE
jgi:uncharacterized repeat protein (TIGR01451 family)/fimbrial isopeptide formation D2 family protein